MSDAAPAPPATTTPGDSTSVAPRLLVMMFLQYFTWGAWWTTLGTYLTFHCPGGGGETYFGDVKFVGHAYATSGLAALLAPFFVGLIADKFFATKWVLVALHAIAAALLYAVSLQTSYWPMLIMLLLYNLAFMPTLALTNSIAFATLADPQRQFPPIRVAGTIGWIVAGLSYVVYAAVTGVSVKDDIEPTIWPMRVALVSQLLLAVWCLFLPHTPPPGRGKRITASDVLGLDALALLRERSFAVFVLCSFLISIPLQFYYAFTNPFLSTGVGLENAVGWMTIGQMSEIGFMLLMPFFFIRLGVKVMLLVGMLSWVLRYVLFAYGDVTGGGFVMLILGLALHGICYDFFFVTGQIYTDAKAGAAIRSAAQGFIAVVTLGLGSLVGNLAAGYVADYVTVDGVQDWTLFWLIPAGFAVAVAVLFAITFDDRVRATAAQELS